MRRFMMGRMWLSLFGRFVLRRRKGKFAVKKVKRPDIETLLNKNKVCIIWNQIGDKPHTAGGVFISKDGLIATCHHILGSSNKYLRIGFSGNTSKMFEAEVHRSFPQLDLAILRVLGCDKKTLKHVKLPRTISLDWGDSVFAFSQAGDLFSVCFGRVAYPYPKRTKLPEVERAEGGSVWITDVSRSLPWLEVQHYLTETEEPGSTLLPNLPIIKVHGVCTDMGGSGCPLFVKKSFRFAGIGLHTRGGRDYFLPSTMIRKPDSLVGRTLGLKYKLTPHSVMYTNGTRKTPLSCGGRGILWGIDLLRSHLSWEVGFPSLLDVWRDKWINGRSLAEILHVPESDLVQKPSISVCQLQNESGGWNADLVHTVCGNHAAAFILSIGLPHEEIADGLFWTAARNGGYTIKTGYSIAFNKLWTDKASNRDLHRMETNTSNFCKSRLWSLPIPGKWRIFLWKILSKSLPIGEEGLKRNLDWDYLCGFCSGESCLETMEHLFRDCPFSSRIWSSSALGIRGHVGDNISIQAWIPQYTIPIFTSTLWRIWCIRKCLKLNRSEVDISFPMTLILTEASLVSSSLSHHSPTMMSDASLPPEDCSEVDLIRNFCPFFMVGTSLCSNYGRLKCDASWKPGFKASAGWFIQSASGDILCHGSRRLWACSPLQAEAAALHYALLDAIKHGLRHIEATTDCLGLVLQVTGFSDATQDAKAIIRSITSLLTTMHCFSISHCPRQLNRIAHSIARAAMD